jgi:hypothetical protein
MRATPIAVHGVVQMRARDVDVAARIERALGKDEAVACLVRLQASDVKVHFSGKPNRCPRIESGRRMRPGLDMALERGVLVAGNFESEEARACRRDGAPARASMREPDHGKTWSSKT